MSNYAKCSVCGERSEKVTEGNFWVPICQGCAAKGWKAEEYYGDNYEWSVHIDHSKKVAYAISL